SPKRGGRAKGKKRGDAPAAKAASAKKSKKAGANDGKQVLDVELPESLAAGQQLVVKLHHTLGADLGKQTLTVTLKGQDNARIERKTVEAEGSGVVEVAFDVPATTGGSVSIAAFVGEDFKKSQGHVNTKPIPVRAP
ncbi:MAG TPA: hypothetical protein VHY20_00550, partial [Pirellulales bacterium]|nr:hypothetical protein [Pirellulales bacterium]